MQSARSSVSRAFGNPGQAFDAGAKAAFTATGGRVSGSLSASPAAAMAGAPANSAPDWARRLRQEQGLRDAGLTATHVIASGDRGGAGEGPELAREDQ